MEKSGRPLRGRPWIDIDVVTLEVVFASRGVVPSFGRHITNRAGPQSGLFNLPNDSLTYLSSDLLFFFFFCFCRFSSFLQDSIQISIVAVAVASCCCPQGIHCVVVTRTFGLSPNSHLSASLHDS